MDVAQIQQAIEELPAEEQTALAAWVVDRDRARWDEEIERDFSPGGAGMALLDKVKKQVSEGLSRPLSEGRPESEGEVWTVDIGRAYRALAWRQGNDFHWYWIGSHEAYDKLLRRER